MSRVGVCLLMTDYSFDVTVLARRVEELGFESLWAPEHGVIPVEYKSDLPSSEERGVPVIYRHGHIDQILNPFVWLRAAAAATRRLMLGTGICLVPEHDPIHLAKEVATLDRLCQGRLIFGIGAGWLRGEAEVFGVDFPRRWSQTREYVMAMKTLWRDNISEFRGSYVCFPPLVCKPKPVQKPHPPILIGGEFEQAAQRILDYGDGWLPRVRHTSPYKDPDKLEQAVAHLRAAWQEKGRDPAQLTVTAWDADHDRASNRRFFEAGAQRSVHIVITRDRESALAQLEELARKVL